MMVLLARSSRRIWQAFCLAVCVVYAGPVQAALLGSCTIIVGASGVLKTNATVTTLSSSNPGGATAKASVITTGPSTPVLASLLCTALLLSNCYTVSVVAPTSFSTSPAGGNNNVNFVSSLIVEGAAGLLSRVLLNGTFAVEVNMTATRTSGMFPIGNYQAMPTIRCE